jgi:hypothetical protein
MARSPNPFIVFVVIEILQLQSGVSALRRTYPVYLILVELSLVSSQRFPSVTLSLVSQA